MTVSEPVAIPPKDSGPVNALERRYREWRETRRGASLYALFMSFALERARAGRRFGVKALAERVRWEVAVNHPLLVHELKVNNSHVAYIARDLVRERPALAEWIEFRRVKEDQG